MKKHSEYAVIYDITEDNERVKVEKTLKGYGFRIQKSVFECLLTKSDQRRLINELKALKIESGFIKIYRLEYSWKDCVIGNVKDSKIDIDDDCAFIV